MGESVSREQEKSANRKMTGRMWRILQFCHDFLETKKGGRLRDAPLFLKRQELLIRTHTHTETEPLEQLAEG